MLTDLSKIAPFANAMAIDLFLIILSHFSFSPSSQSRETILLYKLLINR